MTPRIWVIVGATSIIAEKFAHLVAAKGYTLCLVGRQQEQLQIIAYDIYLRYHIKCIILSLDMTKELAGIIALFQQNSDELDLFIAHSDFTENAQLNSQSINQLIKTNINATALIINAYLQKKQQQYNIIYLSSVAACRGRAKNSLYGASKACIETYLQGLQQTAPTNQHITIVRLGFIDTKQTYGLPGVFYAASPENCAKACWRALSKKKRIVYYPFFWREIIAMIRLLPFFFYRKLNF